MDSTDPDVLWCVGCPQAESSLAWRFSLWENCVESENEKFLSRILEAFRGRLVAILVPFSLGIKRFLGAISFCTTTRSLRLSSLLPNLKLVPLYNCNGVDQQQNRKTPNIQRIGGANAPCNRKSMLFATFTPISLRFGYFLALSGFSRLWPAHTAFLLQKSASVLVRSSHACMHASRGLGQALLLQDGPGAR